MHTGRSERRVESNMAVQLEAQDEPSRSETAVFANISEHGARLITHRFWPAGRQVVVSDALVDFSTKAEVVYCAPHIARQFAVGLRFAALSLLPSGNKTF
jgi:hypothetical protein